MPHARIETFEELVRPKASASALGYRMPGEYEPMEAVWLAPPVNPETWPGCLAEAQRQFADWMSLLAEAVRVRTTDELGIPTNDSWIRDFGPIFVIRDRDTGPDRPAGAWPGAGASRAELPGSSVAGASFPEARLPGLACHDFHFNTWGGKYEVRALDDVVPQHIAGELGAPLWLHDFVLEGGSIEVNGRGTVMTTEQCLLNPNRNPGLDRAAIEAKLHEALGTRHVIWLPGGIDGDDTDGHIDDVARFIDPRTVAILSAPPGHPDHAVTESNLRALRAATDETGGRLDILELPVPEPVIYNYPDGPAPVPASYANFLIANGHVFVPVFGQVADDRALRVLDDAMSGTRIVPVRAEHLVVGLGALHCLSQQQPAVVV